MSLSCGVGFFYLVFLNNRTKGLTAPGPNIAAAYFKGGDNVVITVNGKTVELEKDMNILEYIELKGLNKDRVVVEYNSDIAKKEAWEQLMLKDGDVLEILSFVGGG